MSSIALLKGKPCQPIQYFRPSTPIAKLLKKRQRLVITGRCLVVGTILLLLATVTPERPGTATCIVNLTGQRQCLAIVLKRLLAFTLVAGTVTESLKRPADQPGVTLPASQRQRLKGKL